MQIDGGREAELGGRDGPNSTEVAARIERLLDDLAGLGDPRAVEAAEELVRLLMQLYGAGLERVVEMVADDENGGDRLLAKLAGDPLIEGLLVLHGLHPIDIEERVQGALEQVRPYLHSHAGGVEFLGLDEDYVVHLRLEGSCEGCPSSIATVKLAIERAIRETVPEVADIEVENLSEPAQPATGLLQIEPLRMNQAG